MDYRNNPSAITEHNRYAVDNAEFTRDSIDTSYDLREGHLYYDDHRAPIRAHQDSGSWSRGYWERRGNRRPRNHFEDWSSRPLISYSEYATAAPRERDLPISRSISSYRPNFAGGHSQQYDRTHPARANRPDPHVDALENELSDAKKLSDEHEAELVKLREQIEGLIREHGDLEIELSGTKTAYYQLMREKSQVDAELDAYKLLNEGLISSKAKFVARNTILTDRLAKVEANASGMIDVAAMSEESLNGLAKSLFTLEPSQVTAVMGFIGLERIRKAASKVSKTSSSYRQILKPISRNQKPEPVTIELAESSDEGTELEDIPFEPITTTNFDKYSSNDATISNPKPIERVSALRKSCRSPRPVPQKYFLGQDKIDYVMIPLRADGEPLNPEDLAEALSNGKIYGLNDQVKWEDGMRAASYDDTRFDMWRQYILAVLRDADDFPEEQRQQAWPWLRARIDEAETKDWKRTTWMRTAQRDEEGRFIRPVEGQYP